MAAALVSAAAAREANRRKREGKDQFGDDDDESRPKARLKSLRSFREVGSGIFKYQNKAATVYKHQRTEILVAGLIVSNFLGNMVEKTLDPDPDSRKYETLWVVLEYFYNTAFTIELVINMYGFWFWKFWTSGWNVFDFVVVSIGLMTTLKVPLPGPLKLLRMMRAFRVFRLFKRIESLKKILESLARAVPGVVNAFVILVLVMCIYAILAVEFFRTYGKGMEMKNERGKAIELKTPRDQEYGWEYFGNFPKSLYTMFQVLTGESWAEVVARPLLHSDNTLQSVCYAFFFMSFVVINSIILINVVVAVLLEKMVDPDEGEEPAAEDGDEVAEVSKSPAELLSDCAVDVAAAGQQMVRIQRQLAAILEAVSNDSDSLHAPAPAPYLYPTKPAEAEPPVLMDTIIT